MDYKLAYQLGTIDAMAKLFATIRSSNERAALIDIAKQMMQLKDQNPHAKWYLENFKEE